MRAASTGGGLVRFVAIRLVVLAVLVMTAAGASSTSAAAAATVTATATVTAAAARKTDAVASPPPPPPPNATSSPSAGAANLTANVTACEPVRVSTRKPACTGQITEGPGPPRPFSSSSSSSSSSSLSTSPTPSLRCPAPAPCADSSDNNNVNNNNNNYNNNTSNHQCLVYARRELIPTMCPDDRSAYLQQTGRLERYRLRHCCHHTVESVVQRPYADRESCVDQVESALHMDDVAAAMSCQFDGVLARYDCKQKYSAKSCESCKDAYARWACAAVLPHWTRTANRARTVDDGRPTAANDGGVDGRDGAARGRRYRVKACRSVCLEAEQTCPWLLPVADDTNPYAGEAAFTCMDPDIGYQLSATDTTELCCYEHCAGGLCVRNASACLHGGGGGSDQRPVCVEDAKLPDDGPDEKCDDYSLTDTSDGTRQTAPGAVAMLFLLSSALYVPFRPAWTVAATAIT